jgi:hypothetical protein
VDEPEAAARQGSRRCNSQNRCTREARPRVYETELKREERHPTNALKANILLRQQLAAQQPAKWRNPAVRPSSAWRLRSPDRAMFPASREAPIVVFPDNAPVPWSSHNLPLSRITGPYERGSSDLPNAGAVTCHMGTLSGLTHEHESTDLM